MSRSLLGLLLAAFIGLAVFPGLILPFVRGRGGSDLDWKNTIKDRILSNEEIKARGDTSVHKIVEDARTGLEEAAGTSGFTLRTSWSEAKGSTEACMIFKDVQGRLEEMTESAAAGTTEVIKISEDVLEEAAGAAGSMDRMTGSAAKGTAEVVGERNQGAVGVAVSAASLAGDTAGSAGTTAGETFRAVAEGKHPPEKKEIEAGEYGASTVMEAGRSARENAGEKWIEGGELNRLEMVEEEPKTIFEQVKRMVGLGRSKERQANKRTQEMMEDEPKTIYEKMKSMVGLGTTKKARRGDECFSVHGENTKDSATDGAAYGAAHHGDDCVGEYSETAKEEASHGAVDISEAAGRGDGCADEDCYGAKEENSHEEADISEAAAVACHGNECADEYHYGAKEEASYEAVDISEAAGVVCHGDECADEYHYGATEEASHKHTVGVASGWARDIAEEKIWGAPGLAASAAAKKAGDGARVFTEAVLRGEDNAAGVTEFASGVKTLVANGSTGFIGEGDRSADGLAGSATAHLGNASGVTPELEREDGKSAGCVPASAAGVASSVEKKTAEVTHLPGAGGAARSAQRIAGSLAKRTAQVIGVVIKGASWVAGSVARMAGDLAGSASGMAGETAMETATAGVKSAMGMVGLGLWLGLGFGLGSGLGLRLGMRFAKGGVPMIQEGVGATVERGKRMGEFAGLMMEGMIEGAKQTGRYGSSAIKEAGLVSRKYVAAVYEAAKQAGRNGASAIKQAGRAARKHTGETLIEIGEAIRGNRVANG